MTIKRTLASSVIACAIAASAVCWLAPSGTAHADDQSYLAKLRQTDVVIPLPEGSLVHSGHMVCSFLHRGLRPELQESRYFPSIGTPDIIAAARTELCPDALG